MHQIAGALDAKVQGDEGEEYAPTGQLKLHEPMRRQKPWWRFWG